MDEPDREARTPAARPDQLDEQALSIIGKHDLNLALRACFVLNPKDTRRKVTRRFTVVDESSQKLELTYEVRAADRLPFYRDMETLMAVITLACRAGVSESIDIQHPYQIIKLLGKQGSGKDYHDLAASIDRLADVTMKGTYRKDNGNVWDNRMKWDHLIYTADLSFQEDKETGVAMGKGIHITFGDSIRKSIEKGELATFDWDFYRRLGGGASVKALYIYLNAVQATRWEEDVFDVAETHLGMRHYEYPSTVWQKLEPILQRAKDQGLLKHFELVKRKGFTRVLFVKPSKQISPPANAPVRKRRVKKEAPSAEAPQLSPVAQHLMSLKVGEKKAESLAAAYTPEYIQGKIDILLWKLEYDERGKPIEDTAAWLVRAIEEDYRTPDGFKSPAVLKQEKAEAEQRNAERQAMLDAVEKREEERRQKQEEEQHRRRRKVYQKFATPPEVIALWEQALGEIKGSMEESWSFYRWYDGTYLLSLTEGAAQIGVPKQEHATYLAKWANEYRIKTALKHLGQPVESLTFKVLS